MIFYGYQRCTTANRARQWLKEGGAAVDAERDLILNPLSVDEIRELAALAGGITPILSKKSPKYKIYQTEVQKPEDWLPLMAEEPRLLKRPLVRVGQKLYIGFDPDEWQALLPKPR